MTSWSGYKPIFGFAPWPTGHGAWFSRQTSFKRAAGSGIDPSFEDVVIGWRTTCQIAA